MTETTIKPEAEDVEDGASLEEQGEKKKLPEEKKKSRYYTSPRLLWSLGLFTMVLIAATVALALGIRLIRAAADPSSIDQDSKRSEDVPSSRRDDIKFADMTGYVHPL